MKNLRPILVFFLLLGLTASCSTSKNEYDSEEVAAYDVDEVDEDEDDSEEGDEEYEDDEEYDEEDDEYAESDDEDEGDEGEGDEYEEDAESYADEDSGEASIADNQEASVDTMAQDSYQDVGQESGHSLTDQMATYTVKENDTLMLIAFNLYGDYSKWRSLAQLNNNSTIISVGQELQYYVPAEQFNWTPTGTPYLIVQGDNLSYISLKVYERNDQWRPIWENNRPMIKDPDLIFPGFTLYYPDLDLSQLPPPPPSNTNLSASNTYSEEVDYEQGTENVGSEGVEEGEYVEEDAESYE